MTPRSTPESPDAVRGASRALAAAVGVLCVTLPAFAAWQYLMPAAHLSAWGTNPAGVEQFRHLLHVSHAPLGAAAYRLGFRILLGTSWLAYLLAVRAALAGGRVRRSALLLASGIATGALALFWPASLSSDVYGYVGYGRLAVLYGRNPYLTSQTALAALHDPAAPFLSWDLASPYGPLWSWVSIGLVFVLRGAGLLAQVLALKVVAAVALYWLSRAGAALAERLEPGRGGVTFVALALNPLLLIEGPGNGHNDLVMVALVLAALVAVGEGRTRIGALTLGCAGAIKFIPLLLIPWLAVRAARDEARGRSGRLGRGGAVVLLALAPILVSYAPFWSGMSTMRGLADRWAFGQGHGTELASSFGLQLLAVATYAGASLWVLARPELARIVTGWTIVAAAALIGAAGTWFPWYLAWPWSSSLTRWDRRHVAASLFCLGFAVFLTFRYAV